MRNLLKLVGFDSLFQNFEKEKIDSLNLCKGLQDKDLNSLGIVTIGDKVRFRSALQSVPQSGQTVPTTSLATIHTEHVEATRQDRTGIYHVRKLLTCIIVASIRQAYIIIL